MGATKLGKYTLVSPLGAGGMGEVFLAAVDGPHGFRREVAIKVMRSAGKTAQREALFLSEARTLAELRHRNIVQVFDFDVHEGQPYLVMELLHGASLAALIDGAPLGPAGVAYVGAELAEALAAVHAVGRGEGQGSLVHGDLSPSNVLACSDGALKLLDFGLARRERQDTGAGERAGKLPYLAPELFAGAEPDALTDLYAVGVTLHELLTGERLFRDGDPEAVMQLVTRGLTRPLSEQVPSAPEGLAQLIERCLSRDRGTRPQSARSLARELRAFHEGFGPAELARAVKRTSGAPGAFEPSTMMGSAVSRAAPSSGEPFTRSQVEPAPLAPARRQSSAPRWAFAAGAAVVLVGAGVAWLLPPREEAAPPVTVAAP
ncbi:MAG: protein kinase, partial [Myxococcaceae bacterium]|nr:protein kinase [Myxococcaceae bacterium]